MSFLEELHKQGNKTAYTQNGAISNVSTLNPLLDFFSKAGAMRGKEADAVELFKAAYALDETLALRCLFYLRDIRGGQGERSVFRACLQALEDMDNDVAIKVLPFIGEYGRWDDMFVFRKGATLAAIAQLISTQLDSDEKDMKNGRPVSLMAKWLPSENASSKTRRGQAVAIATLLNLKPRQYRKKLSELRKYIVLLEQSMSNREWSSIKYDKLPSQAHRKHVKAFKRHDNERYDAYIAAVQRGETKINASTLFTYEVYDMVNKGNGATADALWASLPDYTRGENALVLPDVSGSMFSNYSKSVAPISVSVSLALYFAERNTGLFKDFFLEFSSNARLHKVTGKTLSERMESVRRSTGWMGSTNLQSAFDAILDAAVKSNASVDEMPKILYIISDMQFDEATRENSATNLEVAQRKFEAAGYELPHVVFWNVNATYGNDAPATMYDGKVTLISGSNQSTFQYAVAGKTPMESMLDILNSERYTRIVV